MSLDDWGGYSGQIAEKASFVARRVIQVLVVSAEEPVSTGSDHGRTLGYQDPEVCWAGAVVDLEELEDVEGYEDAESSEEDGKYPATPANCPTPARPGMNR